MNFDRLKKMVGQRVRLVPPAVSYTWSTVGEPRDIEWTIRAVLERPFRAVELEHVPSGLVFPLGIDNMQDFRTSGHFMLKCRVIIQHDRVTCEPLPDSRAAHPELVRQPSMSATIDLSYKARMLTPIRHAYRLPVCVTNTGDEILSDWSVEVRFPRRMLEPGLSYPIVRSDARSVTMRRTEAEHSGPLYPGERKETLGIDYYVDDALYDERATLFSEEVVATFYVGTRKVAHATRLVSDLQKF